MSKNKKKNRLSSDPFNLLNPPSFGFPEENEYANKNNENDKVDGSSWESMQPWLSTAVPVAVRMQRMNTQNDCNSSMIGKKKKHLSLHQRMLKKKGIRKP